MIQIHASMDSNMDIHFSITDIHARSMDIRANEAWILGPGITICTATMSILRMYTVIVNKRRWREFQMILSRYAHRKASGNPWLGP